MHKTAAATIERRRTRPAGATFEAWGAGKLTRIKVSRAPMPPSLASSQSHNDAHPAQPTNH